MYMTNIQLPDLQSRSAALPLPTMLVGPQAMQNLFAMMLFSLALMLGTPPNKRLAQLNITILAIHDLTHWAGLAWTIAQTDSRGFAAVLDTKGWSPEVWQLAMYPIGTLAIKGATLLEWSGEIKG